MTSNKVLIVTYYWPPAGGPGVQRWLKFSEYLPEFGIEPVIYTPENPSYPIVDESLLKEVPTGLKVIKTKIWEPYSLAEKINPGNKKYKAGQFDESENQSLLSKISVYIRGNYFIPDARKFWVKPSVTFLDKYLKDNQIQIIITTGPPHSLHLIGLELKKKHPDLKWLADFRDPWTTISYHSQLQLNETSKRKHKELEKAVISSADCVIATGFSDAKSYEKLGAKRVEVITNGFEEKDFESGKSSVKMESSKFKMVYSGGLELARNPESVWIALKELREENPDFNQDFELIFYGNLSEDVRNSIKKYNLINSLNKKGYVSHKESIDGIINSNILMLTNFPDAKSKGIIPGKIFEYMASEKPILAVGPEGGDVSKILKETEAGRYFVHGNVRGIKEYILSIFQNWKEGKQSVSNENYKKYSRENLTGKLVELINEI